MKKSKSSLLKDTFRTIKKSFGRFLAIILMVALSTMVFIGLQMVLPNMRASLVNRLREHNIHDVRIRSYAGVRPEDVKILKDLEGEKKIEFANKDTFKVNGKDYSLSLNSSGNTIDSYIVKKGRMPKNSFEILLDAKHLRDKGDMIGQKISLKNKTDKKDNEILTNTEFTIVGYGNSVDYITLTRGGFDSAGADYFAVVNEGVIKKEHPDFALVSFKEKSKLDITKEKYKAYERDRLEEIKDKFNSRPDEIKDQIIKEANDEISDGKTKISDAKKELADGKKDLDDAKKELDDAKVELDDGKVELDDNEEKLKDAKKELDDGKVELDDNEEKLKDAKKELDDAKKKLDKSSKTLSSSKKQLDSAKKKLDKGKEQIDSNDTKLKDAKKEIDSGKSELSDAKKELDDAKKTLDQSKEDLDDGEKQYKEGLDEYEKNLDEYKAGKKTFDKNKKKVVDGLAEIKSGKEELEKKEKELKDTKDELTANLEKINLAIADLNQKLEGQSKDELANSLSDLEKGIAEVETAINNLKTQIEELEKALDNPDLTDEEKATLETKKAEAEKALEQLEEEKKGLDDKKAKVEAVLKAFASLEDLQTQKGKIEDGLDEIADGEKEIASSKSKLEESEKKLKESLEILDAEEAKLKDAKAKLDDAKNILDSSKKELDKGKKDYNDGLKAYNDGLSDYKEGVGDLNDAQGKYKSGVTKLNKAKTDYKAGLKDYKKGLKSYNKGYKKYSQGKKDYDEGLKEYKDGLSKFNDGKKEYEDGLKDYKDGLTKFNDGKKEYEDALKKYKDGKKEYEDGKKEYEEKSADAKKKISDAEKDISDAEEDIKSIDIPAHKIEGIYDNVAFSIYIDEINSLDTISYIFTAMFYLVAILVTLTTILRMVDTERTQIGTLKALGYSQSDIMMKYMVYGLMAALLGSFLGIAVGHYILLPPIINAYLSPTNLAIVNNIMEYDKPVYITLASLFIIGMTVYLSINKILKEAPAQLMRPKPPKKTKRVLIEKLPFIWKRLSFLNKVSIRNIFLHKIRMLMLIVGVAGSFGLIAMAFGIQSSIGSVVPKQFGDIYKYDGQVIYNEKAKDIDDLKAMINQKSQNNMNIIMDAATITNAQNFNEDVNIIATDDYKKLNEFISIRDRKSKEPYTPEENKVVISEKLSMVLNKKVGDNFVFTDSNGRTHEIEIQAISEQYFNHTAYMTEKTFKKLISEDQEANSNLIIFKDNSSKAMNQFESELMDYESGISFIPTMDMQTSLENISDSLNFVILVIVAVAALLTFVVLYNLTNINISERIREISTIKVLGFRTNEVSSYIFKENYFLTFLGILVGLAVGKGIHSIIVFYLSSGSILFDPYMPPINYLWASILVVVFLSIVLLIERNEIKKIDMVEALKAVD